MAEPNTPLWLIIEWRNSERSRGGYSLINEDTLVEPQSVDDLHTGKVIEVYHKRMRKRANVVMVSNDKTFLEMEFKEITGFAFEDQDGDDESVHTDQADYIESCSDWEPAVEKSPNKVKSKRKSNKLTKTERKKSCRRSFKKNENVDSDQLTYRTTTYFNERQYQKTFTEDVYAYSTGKPSSLPGQAFPISIHKVEETKPSIPPMTFDQQTQTTIELGDLKDIALIHNNQHEMKMDIMQLFSVVESFQTKINEIQKTIQDLKPPNVLSARMNVSELGSTENITMDESRILRDATNLDFGHESMINKTPKAPVDCAEMVPIGTGKTLIPGHIYNQIQWSSYSQATRKLLMAVFPRKTLATHTLTGKSSPAFQALPSKLQLDPKKVSDIIMTVSQMCRVPECHIRNIITIKCSDEYKMYKMRMNKQKGRKNKNEDNALENDDDDD